MKFCFQNEEVSTFTTHNRKQILLKLNTSGFKKITGNVINSFRFH